jgi:hypothetical protein
MGKFGMVMAFTALLLLPACNRFVAPKPSTSAALAFDTSKTANAKPVPSATKYKYSNVTVDVASRWRLSILPNGGGRYGYGSNPWDFDGFPAGTFDFEGVVQRLQRAVSQTAAAQTGCYVAFWESNSAVTTEQAVDDVQLILRLFDQAHNAPKTRLSQVDDIWLANPPAACQKAFQAVAKTYAAGTDKSAATSVRVDPRTTRTASPAKLAVGITNATIVSGLNAPQGARLPVDSLKRILSASEFFPSDIHGSAGWSYAPSYSGTFVANGTSYRVTLFLGGRGEFVCPNGKVRLFTFDPKLLGAPGSATTRP